MKRKCNVDGCGRKVIALGLCSAHYERSRKYGDPLGGGPMRPPISEQRPLGSPCKVAGCHGVTSKGSANGMCCAHYQRARKGTDLSSPVMRLGLKNKRTDRNGYVGWSDPTSPYKSGSTTWVLEHRAVMGQILGRSLRRNENVHHINGNRADNRPANLELWVSLQPSGQRVTDLLEWARYILKTYEADAAKLEGREKHPSLQIVKAA